MFGQDAYEAFGIMKTGKTTEVFVERTVECYFVYRKSYMDMGSISGLPDEDPYSNRSNCDSVSKSI